MFIARCVFENSYGYSKPYSYKINQEQRLALRPNDYVVVTKKSGGYSTALIDSIDTTDDPEIIDMVTEHVCCKITDEFYNEYTTEEEI